MHTQLRSRMIGFVVISAVIALTALWWLHEPGDEALSAAAQREQALAQASASVFREVSPFGAVPALDAGSRPADAASAAATAASAASAPPAGMTAEQWTELQEALKDHPDRDAELRRVARYMAFKDAFERFETARDQHADAARQRELAQVVDNGLDERLAKGEMNAAEARVVKAEVLDVLELDPVRRVEQLQLWVQRQSRGAAAADPRDAQREAQYKQQEAAIVAAWQALPPPQRDPRQLEAQLDALRLRTFNSE